jgi:hypothetical protein
LLFVKPTGAGSRTLREVEGIREEAEMRNRRDTGDLVKFIGVIGIIAVMSIVVGAALIGGSSVAAVMPDWSERHMVEMGR